MTRTEQAVWRAAHLPRFDGDAFPKEVDVAVVGGGITGLTAAFLLKQSGRTVAVFERERIGAGETGNTSGHLTYVTDQPLQTLVRRFGRGAARLVWEGGARAIDLIETVATGQDETRCAFRRVPGFCCAPFVKRDYRRRRGPSAPRGRGARVRPWVRRPVSGTRARDGEAGHRICRSSAFSSPALLRCSCTGRAGQRVLRTRDGAGG